MTDKEYEDIVKTMDRPVIVLAGPGAGKTYLCKRKITMQVFRKIRMHEKQKITM